MLAMERVEPAREKWEEGGEGMLFTAVLKAKEGSTSNERIMRRAQYSFPEGFRPVTEYWLQTIDPSLPHVVVTFEADSVEPILQIFADWDDHFHITVVPTITAEQGLQVIEQMMQEGQDQAQ
jgi:hypothetical protein